MTEDEVVAELRDGMTIGIGGWGSRRKPMSLVRAILRSDLKDLSLVAYGGPDVGLLCAAGKVRKVVYGFVSLDSIPLEPHFRKAKQAGAIEFAEFDEGAFLLGLMAAAHRMPFYPDPRRPGQRHDDDEPDAQDGEVALRRRRRVRGRARVRPRRGVDPHEPGRRARQRAVPRARPVLRRHLRRWAPRRRSCRPSRSSTPPTSPSSARCTRRGSPACTSRAWSRPRWARTSPSARPTTSATRRSNASTPRPHATKRRGRRSRRRISTSTAMPNT